MMCKAAGSDLLWSSAALSHAVGLDWQSLHNGSLCLIRAKVLGGWSTGIRLKTEAHGGHQRIEAERTEQAGEAVHLYE